MLKKIGYMAVMGLTVLSLAACVPDSATAPKGGRASGPPAAVRSYPALSSDELQQFDGYIPSIKGASFIQVAEIRNQNEAYIQYFPNFSEYEAAGVDGKISEAEFEAYFAKLDTVYKVLMEESLRLLRNFPAITRITIKIPHNSHTYAINTSKRSIENYMKISFNKYQGESGKKQWKEMMKKYFTAKEREKFALRFIRAS